jgi:CO/xanthine dehydrogenase Mo-binding subunit
MVPWINLHGTLALLGSYHLPNMRVTGYRVYTNSVPRGHGRAPGEPQARFAIESHTDMVACQLGIDPAKFRLRNCLHDGSTLPIGEPLEDVRQEETIRACMAAAGWGEQKPHQWYGRGMAVSDRQTGSGFASVRLTLNADATLTLFTGMPDTGTGAHTMMVQVIAEELGVPPDKVRVRTAGTLEAPSDSGVGGSRVTHVGGQAALGAARALAARLPDMGLWIGQTAEPLTVEFRYDGHDAPVASFSCQIAEVSVDPETGQVMLERLTSAHDSGTVLNPTLFEGQIKGGLVQGLGMAMMEDLQLDEGRVTASHLGEYKLPSIADVPAVQTIIIEGGVGPGPHNAKSVGESANTPVPGAIANAIFDACGVRLMSLPLTAEKVHAGLRTRMEGTPT